MHGYRDRPARNSDIVIADGKVKVTSFKIRLGKEYVDFKGGVGLDESKSLAMKVSLPVSSELLAKLKVPANLQGYVAKYVGDRVEIPLGGTVSEPKLDYAGLMKPFIERAAKALLRDKVLQQLQPKDKPPPDGGKDGATDPKDDKPAPKTQPADPDVDRIIKGIFDVLDKSKTDDGKDRQLPSD